MIGGRTPVFRGVGGGSGCKGANEVAAGVAADITELSLSACVGDCRTGGRIHTADREADRYACYRIVVQVGNGNCNAILNAGVDVRSLWRCRDLNACDL